MLDYIQKTQYVNNDMKMSVNDNNGIEISNPNYSLGDGPQWSDDNYGYPNSYLE